MVLLIMGISTLQYKLYRITRSSSKFNKTELKICRTFNFQFHLDESTKFDNEKRISTQKWDSIVHNFSHKQVDV